MVSKLFNVKDEYQLEQFNRLFAKISALVSILMLALLYFEAIFDVERSYLSPYIIGVLLCLIVLACMLMTNGYSEESKEIYVRNEEEKKWLKKMSLKKRMIAFGITSIYLLLVNLIIVPLVTKGHIDRFQFSQITPFIVPFIILILSDKRIKVSKTPTAPAKEKLNTTDRLLNLIPQYNFSDEYERMRIEMEYAKNCIWLLPALLIISIVDIIISVVMHHMPYAPLITLLIIVIFIAIALFKVHKIKKA